MCVLFAVSQGYGLEIRRKILFVKAMFIKNCKKAGLICLEVFALLFLLALVGVSVLLWRMSQQPVDIGFVKPHIQSAIKDANIGFDLAMERVFLEWPKFEGPLLIGFGDVRLIGENDAEILKVDSVGVGLNYAKAFIGKIRPTAIIVNNPSLQIERGQKRVSLRLQDTVIRDSEEQSDAKDLNWQQMLALRLTEIADQQFAQSTFFSDLERVEMRRARVLIDDQVAFKVREFNDIDASLLRSDVGASFRVDARLPREGDTASGFSAQLDYIKNSGNFTFDMNFQNVNPFLFGEIFHHAKVFKGQDLAFNGQLNARLNRVLNPVAVDIKIASPRGEIALDGKYETPLQYADVQGKLSYKAADARMQVETLQAKINDVLVNIKAQADFQESGIDVPIQIEIPEITAQQTAALIPQSEINSDGGEWVGQKLRDGVYRNIAINIGVKGENQNVVGERGPRRERVWGVGDTSASFDFEDMTIDYSDTLTAATKADGRGEFDGDNLVITGSEAFVGGVRGSNLNMTFSDFMVTGGGVADIQLDVDGSLPSFLEYLALDPINMGDDLGVSPDDAKGQLKAKLDISFPTLKDIPKETVKVTVSGQLNDLYLPDMVEGLALSGGPVALNLKDGALNVKGKGQIANRDVTLDWTQNLDSTGKNYAMKVSAQLAADKELRHHFGVELDEFISGTLPIDLDYTEKQNGDATILLKGRLAPMSIDIEPFAYKKPGNVDGDVSMRLHIKKGVLTHIDNLNLRTVDLSVKGARLDFRKLKGDAVELSRAILKNAKIGKTVQNAIVDISADNVWSVVANGPVFDAGPFLRDKTPEEKANGMSADNPYFKIDLDTDVMLTKKDQSIQKTKLKVDLNRSGHVEMLSVDAFAGKGTIYVRYKPNEFGQRNFEMQATDAGATLKAFDVFGDVIGGEITIRGEPVGGGDADDIYGRAQMKDFRVVNAPALARLINAMSLSGFEDSLGEGGGIEFARLDGDFEWDFRPQGSLIRVQNGRTSGSSLGITFEGSVDRATNELDINGTIVPMSGINNFIGNIPLVGEILTGGSGIIAATYTMRGQGDDPKVSINPLSVLTPGFLRRILFEGGGSSNDNDVPILRENDDRTAPSTPKAKLEPKTSTEDLLDFQTKTKVNE